MKLIFFFKVIYSIAGYVQCLQVDMDKLKPVSSSLAN